MPTYDFLVGFFISLGIGGLIGLEREHHRDTTQIVAGVRTFPLISVFGFLLATLTQQLTVSRELGVAGGVVVATGLFAVFGYSVALLFLRHERGVAGLTTPVAMVVTYLAGLLIGFNRLLEGAVVGVATTFLLLTKQRLHGFAARLTDEEMLSALQFITLAFILFPLAPDEPLRLPLGATALRFPLTPRWILLIVLLVSGLSFASFLALRHLGPTRGVEATGLLGGFVNSEAVAASLATLARTDGGLTHAALLGTLFANSTMLLRNLVIAGFTDLSLAVARTMLLPLLLMFAAITLYALSRERTPPLHGSPITLQSPFALRPAARFAALFVLLSGAAFLAQQALGELGVYATALGGFVSSGAVVASVATLAFHGEIAPLVAAQTAVAATILSTVNKLLVVGAVNRGMVPRLRAPITLTAGLGVAALAGLLLR